MITHATNNEGKGTRVLQLKKGSVAAIVGIESDDIIEEIDGEVITGYESFEIAMNKKAVNQNVTFTIDRKSEKLKVNCLVDAYPVPY